MINRQNYTFTSESVGEGHPDKVCDMISDSVLDKALSLDPESRVACECFASTGLVIVGGEITTNGYIDIIDTVRNTLKEIGYNNPLFGIDYHSCSVISAIKPQSGDISQGVTEGTGKFKEQGAGDQGIMFGYACRDTEELMPAPIQYSHHIMEKTSEVRKNGKLPFLAPDGKCQVTVHYENGKPAYIPTVVLSNQHLESASDDEIENGLINEVIKKVLPSELIDEKTRYLINPTGRFVTGGPEGDVGLTGRKIIVDTYGGAAPHGGGAFSGKDPSKVDRSAAYMARYIAKNIVAAEICEKCDIQLAYAIGVADPVSIYVNTHSGNTALDEKLEKMIPEIFSLKPAGIISTLDLKKPVFKQTAAYGHFGNANYSWEQTDKATELAKAIS